MRHAIVVDWRGFWVFEGLTGIGLSVRRPVGVEWFAQGVVESIDSEALVYEEKSARIYAARPTLSLPIRERYGKR